MICYCRRQLMVSSICSLHGQSTNQHISTRCGRASSYPSCFVWPQSDAIWSFGRSSLVNQWKLCTCQTAEKGRSLSRLAGFRPNARRTASSLKLPSTAHACAWPRRLQTWCEVCAYNALGHRHHKGMDPLPWTNKSASRGRWLRASLASSCHNSLCI